MSSQLLATCCLLPAACSPLIPRLLPLTVRHHPLSPSPSSLSAIATDSVPLRKPREFGRHAQILPYGDGAAMAAEGHAVMQRAASTIQSVWRKRHAVGELGGWPGGGGGGAGGRSSGRKTGRKTGSGGGRKGGEGGGGGGRLSGRESGSSLARSLNLKRGGSRGDLNHVIKHALHRCDEPRCQALKPPTLRCRALSLSLAPSRCLTRSCTRCLTLPLIFFTSSPPPCSPFSGSD